MAPSPGEACSSMCGSPEEQEDLETVKAEELLETGRAEVKEHFFDHTVFGPQKLEACQVQQSLHRGDLGPGFWYAVACQEGECADDDLPDLDIDLNEASTRDLEGEATGTSNTDPARQLDDRGSEELRTVASTPHECTPRSAATYLSGGMTQSNRRVGRHNTEQSLRSSNSYTTTEALSRLKIPSPALSLKAAKAKIGDFRLNIKNRLDRAEQALREAPLVALLVKPDLDWTPLPRSVRVVAEAKVEFRRQPRLLLLVHFACEDFTTGDLPRRDSSSSSRGSRVFRSLDRSICRTFETPPSISVRLGSCWSRLGVLRRSWRASIEIGSQVIVNHDLKYLYEDMTNTSYTLLRGMTGVVVSLSLSGDVLIAFRRRESGLHGERAEQRWVLKQDFGVCSVRPDPLQPGFQVSVEEPVASDCGLQENVMLAPGMCGIVQETLDFGVRVLWSPDGVRRAHETFVLREEYWKLSIRSPADQLLDLVDLLKDFLQEACASYGPWMWAVHKQEVREAVAARELLVATRQDSESSPKMAGRRRDGPSAESGPPGLSAASSPSSWGSSSASRASKPGLALCKNRVMSWLCIKPPSEQSSFLRVIRDHYGEGVAFSIAWSGFYAQQLWILAVLCGLFLLFECRPVGGNYRDYERLKFEFAKCWVVLWALHMAWKAEFQFVSSQSKADQISGVTTRPSQSRSLGCCRRTLKLVFVAFPAILLFYSIVITILILHTQLLLYVIYDWGDCLRLHTVEQPCRDPQVKHGYWLGVLVEILLDVLLAIIFELIFLGGQALAAWISKMREYRYASDEKFFCVMLTVALAALDRIGFVSTLAFCYAPQWAAPADDTALAEELCEGLGGVWQMFGESNYWCLQKRLPVEKRRWVFMKLMKGPFLVAPFVQLLMTVIVPKFVECLDRICVPRFCTSRCCAPCWGFLRIWSMIFTYDSGSTGGCCEHIVGGNPFGNITISSNWGTGLEEYASADLDDTCQAAIATRACDLSQPQQEALVKDVLHQVLYPPFEPYVELLNEKMNLLWVIFCTPVFPAGVFATLLARVVRLKLIVEKLLHVRRRGFPEHDGVMRRLMIVYVRVSCFASVGWSIGLSCITYNDDLWKLTYQDNVILVCGLVAWLGFAVCLLFACPIS